MWVFWCVYVCVRALLPPQTSPLMSSHWRSSHSQFLPWMRLSPGGWQVHCPHRHWPAKSNTHLLTTEQRLREFRVAFDCHDNPLESISSRRWIMGRDWFFSKLILACQCSRWPHGEILYVNHSLEPTLTQANTPTFTSRCCDATSISRRLGGMQPVSTLANGETHYGNIIYSDLWPEARCIPAHWSFQRAARGCMN